jgi:hypothetical protein
VPEPVATAPDTATSPLTDKFVFDPDTPPDNVNVDASDTIDDAPVNVTTPAIEFAPDTLRITPPEDTPVPTTDTASDTANGPRNSSAAPDTTDVEPVFEPRPFECSTETTPPVTLTAPLNVLLPDNVSVLEPNLVIAPVATPEMIPDNV